MDRYKKLVLQLRQSFGPLLFLRYVPQSFLYSLQRDRLQRHQRRLHPSNPLTSIGQLQNVQCHERGADFSFTQAQLAITFLTPDLVRVTWTPGKLPVAYAIAKSQWQPVQVSCDRTDETWKLTTSRLALFVDSNGRLQLHNRNGQLLRDALPPQRRGEGWIDQAQLRPEERIYGLGERAFPLNLRPKKDSPQTSITYKLWNFDPAGKYAPGDDPLYLCIPVYIGLHSAGSYLIFYENSHRGTITLNDEATADFEGGALRYYLTIGSPPQLLERYSELTGRPPLPPRWALGYHQSRWGYQTRESVIRKLAENFQHYRLPLSAIHLDIDSQVGFRAFTLDPQRYPQIAKLTQELAAQGIHFIAINNPGVKYSRQNNLLLEGEILDTFCKLPDGKPAIAPVWPGWSLFPDFTDPKVRRWWSRQYEYLLDVGISGFWHDMNEPAAFVIWGDGTLPAVTQHCLEGRGGDHREAHNVYGLLQAEAAFESLCHYRPQQRPFIVSRSGWAGLQRYAWTWTGDIESSWAALRQTVATVLGLGLSGIPYTGADIGGFQGNPTPELYLRWFQYSSFFPFCRTHSSINAENRLPWTYGEPCLSIVREFLHLRYRLLPYFYTLAWEAAQKGYPLVRPLFWADWENPELWDVDDAFLLGDALLIYPILEPRADRREAILPQGHWYDFWQNIPIEGGKRVTLKTSLERIPVLVKAGSIVPMAVEATLILHLYPPTQGSGEGYIYSDAGDGYGQWRLDRFCLVRDRASLNLSWDAQGEYEFPYQGVQLHLHGMHLEQAWIDGQAVAVAGQKLACDRFREVQLLGQFETAEG